MPFVPKLMTWNVSGFACMLFSLNQCKIATQSTCKWCLRVLGLLCEYDSVLS